MRRAAFLLASGLFLLGLSARILASADLVFVGGKVYTLDSGQPWADALAVSGDKIVHVVTRQVPGR